MIQPIIILATLLIGFSLQALVCCIIFNSPSFMLLTSISFVIVLVVVSLISKQHFLLQKRLIASMVVLAIWLFTSVYFMIMALSLLIYLSEYQQRQIKFDSHLLPFMVYCSTMNFENEAWINLSIYFGIGISAGFYTREYYRIFWVNSIVHIYRYLKKKVKNLNQTLLSNLPVVPFMQQLQSVHCSLCLQYYNQHEPIARLSCTHCFHRNCIRIWVIKSNACPLCRRRVIFY